MRRGKVQYSRILQALSGLLADDIIEASSPDGTCGIRDRRGYQTSNYHWLQGKQNGAI